MAAGPVARSRAQIPLRLCFSSVLSRNLPGIGKIPRWSNFTEFLRGECRVGRFKRINIKNFDIFTLHGMKCLLHQFEIHSNVFRATSFTSICSKFHRFLRIVESLFDWNHYTLVELSYRIMSGRKNDSVWEGIRQCYEGILRFNLVWQPKMENTSLTNILPVIFMVPLVPPFHTKHETAEDLSKTLRPRY